MSDRDAFGREKGEDPLAGMGWSSSINPSPPAPATTPAAAPPPTVHTLSTDDLPPTGSTPAWTPGPRPASVRRRRRRGGIFVPLFIIGLVALAIGGVTTAINAGSDAIENFTASVDANGVTTRTTPSSGTTLIAPAALKAALAKLPAGQIEILRVAPERINANVIVKGRMHTVQVTAGGDVTDVKTPATGGGDYVKVNAAAPQRIVRTAARRAGRRPGTVSYLVLMEFGGSPQWQLFFDDGLHFSAGANGKKVKRVG
jgi:hypothetical protein